jgi:hypothetical protein
VVDFFHEKYGHLCYPPLEARRLASDSRAVLIDTMVTINAYDDDE